MHTGKSHQLMISCDAVMIDIDVLESGEVADTIDFSRIYADANCWNCAIY